MDRIIGRVDGFRDDILHGWLANLDEPNGLEQFIVRDDWEQNLVLSTNFYRADVCNAYNINGIFGFAINRAWLDPRSTSISIVTRCGTVLPGGENIRLPESRAAAPPRDSVDIFLHLAKTAGTSVRHALSRALSEGETLLVYPGAVFGVAEPLISTMPLEQQRRLRLVIGHCNFGVHAQLAVPARYSVFLRDPAARLRSNFAHHGVAGTVFRHNRQPVNLVTAFNEGLTEEFDNLMVRVIAGLSRDEVPPGTVSSADVDRALQNIRTHFKFVGLYETMAESFVGLCDALGLPQLVLPADNVTPPAWPDAERRRASIDWGAVFARNRHDIALYDAVRQSGLVGRIG